LIFLFRFFIKKKMKARPAGQKLALKDYMPNRSKSHSQDDGEVAR
jgi:hypothetical protein